MDRNEAAVVGVSIFQTGEREYWRRNYIEAEKLLVRYLTNYENKKNRDNVFEALDYLGRIYLRTEKTPEKVLKLFKKYEKDESLTEAQMDTLEEWIYAVSEWNKQQEYPVEGASFDEIFKVAEKYYENGVAVQEYRRDPEGRMRLTIASKYLQKYLQENDKGARIPDVLFMLGDIRGRVIGDYSFAGWNFYFKELIQRFPNTPTAWKGYKIMEEDIRASYTGSSGDNIPGSIVKMLERYKKLAKTNK